MTLDFSKKRRHHFKTHFFKKNFSRQNFLRQIFQDKSFQDNFLRQINKFYLKRLSQKNLS